MPISPSGDDADEFARLLGEAVRGGTVTLPLEKQMWGDISGMCVDRFGVPWMVDIVQPQT